jgi:iron complex outermembrane receptor protein
MKFNAHTALKLSSACAVIVAALAAAPVLAQSAPAKADKSDDVIVVTGSLIKQDLKTPLPLTVINVDSLDKRGISTVQDGIQKISANNGPALVNSFTANGAFAAGASAVSLRGLSTNSTLVLFDGLRAAYYPIADDGVRNFVDLNTVPDDIIERIDILRDGASSTYGADAIAGVVNIITKKQFKGVGVRLEDGISSRGDAPSKRITFTAGTGDLSTNGYNAYISGFYEKSDTLYNRQRPYPYNSADNSNICYNGTCGANHVVNGATNGVFNGLGTSAAALSVRPYNATNTAALGRYQNLSGCGNLPTYTLSAADLAKASNASAPFTVCQDDPVLNYGVIQPEIEKFGVSGKFTANVGDSSQVYAEINFIQTRTAYAGEQATIRAAAPTGILYPQYSTASNASQYAAGSAALTLPIYVCAGGVNCTAANGTLNPNNPFAAQGEVARLIGRLPNIQEYNETRDRTYRGAIGIKGSIFGNWDYKVEGTAMHTDLARTSSGYVYIQHLLNVIADGSYNFVNLGANTAAQNAYLAPTLVNEDSSDLYQAQATLSGKLFDLPGGPAQAAVGTSIYYEAVNDPSGNPDDNGPTQRYFRLNAFGTIGHRTVKSVFGEISLPVVKPLEFSLSGRYDNYSSGQSAFSPKAGFRFSPNRLLTVRGSVSRGFRIPSFAESNSLPTTGYVTINPATLPNSFLAQYGCSQANISTCDSYIRGNSYGLTTVGTAGLQPEKSTSFTAGVALEPIRNWVFTADYYNITKDGAIVAAAASPAIAAYYAGTAVPAGQAVIPGAPDVNFPNAKPLLGFVQVGYVNAGKILTSGIDFTLNGSAKFGKVKWTTNAEASVILLLETEFADGHIERYDGTLGNYNLTAGSGTPKWHGHWTNTFTIGQFDLTGTANYFGGYDLSAQDQNTGYKDCGLSNGNQPCRVKSYITFDLVGSVKINEHFTIYGNMLNVFDRLPPIDNVTYGANNYNPVTGGNGILGRYFTVGAKVKF